MAAFDSYEASRRFVQDWESQHNPLEQARRDIRSGLESPPDGDIFPWEKELRRSHDKEIQQIGYKFHSEEGKLYKKYKLVETLLIPAEKEYRRLRQNVGDRDPEVYIPPILLLLICLIFTGGLSALHYYLLNPLLENQVFRIACSVLMAVTNTAIGYFAGRFIRQYDFRHRLFVMVVAVFALYMGGLLYVIYCAGINPGTVIIGVVNLVMLLLVIILSHLTYDKEPHYPPVKKQYDKLIKERQTLANERLENHENCRQSILWLSNSAMQISDAYRKHLVESRMKSGDGEFREFPRPPVFEKIELALIEVEKLKSHISLESAAHIQ